jgi:hypothetical protein
MKIKELKQLLKELPDEMEIVFGERNPFECGKLVQYKTLKTVKPITAARSISGNYYPKIYLNGSSETNPVRLVEMVYD